MARSASQHVWLRSVSGCLGVCRQAPSLWRRTTTAACWCGQLQGRAQRRWPCTTQRLSRCGPQHVDRASIAQQHPCSSRVVTAVDAHVRFICCARTSNSCVRCFMQCVAVSPCNDRVAAGDATGRILIWHGVGAAVAAAAAGDDAKQQQPQQPQQQDGAAMAPVVTAAASAAVSAPPPVVTSVHWHAHGVRALAFSLDAQRLLSGGDEAVLVRQCLASFLFSSKIPTPSRSRSLQPTWIATVTFKACQQCSANPAALLM